MEGRAGYASSQHCNQPLASWEANSHPASNKFPELYRTRGFSISLPTSNQPSVVPILSQLNPLHTFTSQPFHRHLSQSSHLPLGLTRFPPNSVRISLLTHTCYLFRPSHTTWSNHHNTARRILKWSSALWSFLQYRVTDNSRHTSHQPVVKCSMSDTMFHTHQNNRQNYGPVHFYLSVLRQQTRKRKEGCRPNGSKQSLKSTWS